MEEQKTITINGRDYFVESLSTDAIRYINHLIAIGSQVDKLNFELEQLLGSREYFTELLLEVLPESE